MRVHLTLLDPDSNLTTASFMIALMTVLGFTGAHWWCSKARNKVVLPLREGPTIITGASCFVLDEKIRPEEEEAMYL